MSFLPFFPSLTPPTEEQPSAVVVVAVVDVCVMQLVTFILLLPLSLSVPSLIHCVNVANPLLFEI